MSDISDIKAACLEQFPNWLKELGQDVQILQRAMVSGVDRPVQEILVGGINYLFKSLDLVPDGIDDIGYLDDAFVLRVSARMACDTGIDALNEEQRTDLGRLADQTGLIKGLLGDDLYGRFFRYCESLRDGSARGRTVAEIIDDSDVGRAFGAETTSFVQEYEAPDFTRDEKNLIKLTSFFDAKLPR